jgi:hypothetical protein
MGFLEKVYKKSESIVSRRIGDEYILVPIRQDVGDLESIYTLNETGALIWELIDGKLKVGEIKESLLDAFEVEPEEAEKDLKEHLQPPQETVSQCLCEGLPRRREDRSNLIRHGKQRDCHAPFGRSQ